ncbi:hypothetical protein [Metabacillus rhizolycopersici]|uniref:Uncharacterized protein n=1 Tax=Metabacillus rhizolycopersici TaxID=2875709 RepID=A0ABS7UZJ8_9BACI|nr:hypothetical protein [Metabacillus rhizolycopersici]MBZ5753755.1 hypothetical protein [Metabacillus rhizolycopersici]
MKLDHRRRKIQQEYRKHMRQKKEAKKHTIEAIIIITFFALLFLLNSYFKGF